MNISKTQRTPQACCPPSVQACKTRSVLTLQQALHIFKIKLAQSNLSCRESGRKSAAAVARSFGVNEKTVRDIWAGRTWIREMMHLDPVRAAKASSLKLPGRPTNRSKQEGNHQRYQQAASCSPCSFTVELTGDPHVLAPFWAKGLHSSSQPPPVTRTPEASSADDDPFHEDWPHWAAADLWEQRAAEEGYTVSAPCHPFRSRRS